MEAGRLTIGDITTGVMAYRWFGLGNPREAMPNLSRYYERLTERAGLPRACHAAADVRPARIELSKVAQPVVPALERGPRGQVAKRFAEGLLDSSSELTRGFRGNERKLGLASTARYLIACGLIGEPVPPVMTSGGPQKKNS